MVHPTHTSQTEQQRNCFLKRKVKWSVESAVGLKFALCWFQFCVRAFYEQWLCISVLITLFFFLVKFQIEITQSSIQLKWLLCDARTIISAHYSHRIWTEIVWSNRYCKIFANFRVHPVRFFSMENELSHRCGVLWNVKSPLQSIVIDFGLLCTTIYRNCFVWC